MKIKPEHAARMKEAISKFSPDQVASHRRYIVEEGRARDVEKRLRWDLSHQAGLTRFICDDVYSYADDEHIDTALRAIVDELFPDRAAEPAGPRM